MRDSIQHYRSLIQYSETIVIATPSLSFTTLTNDDSFWNARVTLPVEFRTEPCKELPILEELIPDALTCTYKSFAQQEIARFFGMPLNQFDAIPKVFTDRSSITIATK